MTPIKVWVIVIASMAAAGAERQVPQEPPRFRVAVDAVSIDAVVTDRNGAVVRDLTAADFEVLQDGKRQKITFAQFVPVATAAVTAAAGAAAPAAVLPPAAAPSIAREPAARTILILVDDLGLSFEGMSATRRALRNFVDTRLLPTDFVAIVRAGEMSGLLQPPTNDRAVLQAAVDALGYNTMSRKTVSPSADVFPGLHGPEIEDAAGAFTYLGTAGSLAALNLVVQGAGDVPGRKTVILLSEGFDMRDPQVRAGLDRAIDQATRSGVVIYALDGGSLATGLLTAADDIHRSAEAYDPRARDSRQGGDALGPAVRRLAAERSKTMREAQESLAYVAEPTGGFAVLNTNDLAGGLGRISNDVRDYYIIGYVPDPDTFAPQGQLPRVHSITVNVRRPDVRVRTRKEFLGVSDPERRSSTRLADQLMRAAISSFSATSIALHATHLAGYTPKRGLFVRTVLHVDANALAFSADANDIRTASADLVGVVFNSNGAQVGEVSNGFDVRLKNEAAEPVPGDGVVYTVRMPIDKPGGYQVRYVVRDRRSGAIGSVGGFVTVPDVPGGAFALSGLDLRADERTEPPESLDSDRFAIEPVDALHVYAAGTKISYSYEIYNARTAVQAAASLWRGADRVTSLSPVTVEPPADGRQFTVTGTSSLADDLPAGVYVLQIVATTADPKQPTKTRFAIQRVSFDVK